MASTIQIVPKFSFPYVETYVNDYTEVVDTGLEQTTNEPVVRYVFPFISSKGIDNVFIRKRTRKEIVNTYGDSAYSKYGQPLMQALNVSENSNTEIFCMRVMPESATYANSRIMIKCSPSDPLSDTILSAVDNVVAANLTSISNLVGKFEIMFSAMYAPEANTEPSLFDDSSYYSEPTFIDDGGSTLQGMITGSDDHFGYESTAYEAPLMTVYSAGRGDYGNLYRFRITPETTYQKEYGIKFYNFETLSTENGLKKIANYVGCAATSSRYNNATLINDIIDDYPIGSYPIKYYIDERVTEEVYNRYIDWCNACVAALIEARSAIKENYNNTVDADNSGEHGRNADVVLAADPSILTNTYEKAFVAGYNLIVKKIAEMEKNLTINLDEFDIFFGNNIAGVDSNIKIIKSFNNAQSAGVTGINDNSDYDVDAIDINVIDGNTLFYGSNGTFTYDYTDSTFLNDLEDCYTKAFNGTYDKRILSAQRTPVVALFDANYPDAVKSAMVQLALTRNDGLVYLDSGILPNLSYSTLNELTQKYSDMITNLTNQFESLTGSNIISKNIQHYYIKEPTSKKRVPVTITYFLSKQYASHVIDYGTHIPFVKSYARLSGHIRDSLYPTIDNYEYNFKELLAENRFNYFETIGDNIFQRACQNTDQTKVTDLLEENNVATLYELKRAIEEDINDRLYNFADADVRSTFKDYEDAKFATWKNNKVQDFSIEFRMNEWEAERSILHCYLDVTFRGLMKRAILEIDINKRDNSALAASTATGLNLDSNGIIDDTV